ncbi:MAG: methyltransferase domain-containing protein [Acidobacteriota bacterium]
MKTNDEMSTNGSDQPASMAGVGTHEVVLDLFRRFVPEPAKVADLAAGEGAFSIRLKELGHDVRAVDASSDNWKVPAIPLVIRDLDSDFSASLVEKSGRFDVVAAIEIVEHLENPFRFIRECAGLLKPGGLMFLTTPNVEAVNSRLIFLYTGRLKSFGAYETVRPAHITPIFKWKLEMMLEEAGFETVDECFNRYFYATGTNLKGKIAAVAGRLLSPLLKGEKGGEGRIVVARLRS